MFSKEKIIKILRWSEKYTKTDMVYFTKGSFWLLLGKITSLLISLATMFAFARWVSKETFGKFQYIDSTINIIAIFLLPAMGVSLVRAIAQGKEGMLALGAKVKARWSLLAIMICLGISAWYLGHGNLSLGYSFLVSSFLLPFPRIFNLYSTLWNGRKRFDIQNKYTIYINALEAISFIPVLLLTNNIIIIILAYFITRSIFRGIFFVITLKQVENKKIDQETIPFGKHLTLMDAFGIFADKIDKIIIWQFLGPIAVATYSFAQIPVQKSQGLAPFTSLALPKLSQKNISEIKKGLLKKFFKFFLFSIPLSLIFIVFASFFYSILFPNYMESVPYARVLGLSLILIPFSLLKTSLTAAKKTKQLYIIKFIWPTIKIILFIALVPNYGIWGIVIAFLAAQLIESLLTFYFFLKA